MGVHESHWVNGRRYKRMNGDAARKSRRRTYRRLRKAGYNCRMATRARDWTESHVALVINAAMANREENSKGGKP